MSHRYLLEPLSKCSHVKTKLTDRFLKFYKTVKHNPRPGIRNLFNLQVSDFRSDFGHNVLSLNNGLLTSLSHVKRGSVKYHEIHSSNLWRVPILSELLSMRDNKVCSNLNVSEISDLIYYISCT